MNEGVCIDSDSVRTFPLDERKLPWIFDVLVYPASQGGMAFFCVLVLIPILLDLASWWLEIVLSALRLDIFMLVVGLVMIGVKFLLLMYLFWYFAECIRDSAIGEVRAPDSLAIDREQGFEPLLRILACVLIFLGAGPVYYWNTKAPDAVFWGLMSAGVFFFPMGLLAVVMFDSVSGLNPLRILNSIFRTFFLYCGVALVFYVLIFSIVWVIVNLGGVLGEVSGYFVYAVSLYLFIVSAHLLGRFYYRMEERLNWPV